MKDAFPISVMIWLVMILVRIPKKEFFLKAIVRFIEDPQRTR